jgi:hypothetical protein
MPLVKRLKASRRGTMDVFKVASDGGEELLASGLSSKEIADLRDWFCYTKPLGHGMKIAVRPAPQSGGGFSLVTAGQQLDCAEVNCDELQFT